MRGWGAWPCTPSRTWRRCTLGWPTRRSRSGGRPRPTATWTWASCWRPPGGWGPPPAIPGNGSWVGAPLVPGSEGPVADADAAAGFAREHGLPIAIKAAFGGGGRGLKVAREAEEIPELFASAVREAEAAFGRGECYVERYLERPRHVEVQVLADTAGTVVVAGDRDCSLQRRHQKLVEEAPAPALDERRRAELHRAAHDICVEAGYAGAGTVEFLVGADGTVTFLEVNTRLQVEHPVTEEVTGIDLVREMFRVAAGERLDPATPAVRGHAVEFRINGEEPRRGFLPTPGANTRWPPPGRPR